MAIGDVTVTSRNTSQTTPPRARELPADAPQTITVGGITATKVAQTADLIRYVATIAGKPTFVDLVAKFNAATSVKAPEGFLQGRKGLLLTDRDGVLNKAGSFLNQPSDVNVAAMIPAALEGARALNAAGIGVAIVTNQGGWQTNRMSFENMIAVNLRVAEEIAAAGGRIDAIVICPFNAELEGAAPGEVDARKPAAGMPLHAIAMANGVKVPVVGMAGDQRTDGGAGQGAGLEFFAITDTSTGRWADELATAQRRRETLPTLQTGAGKMREVATFRDAAQLLVKARGHGDESGYSGGAAARDEHRVADATKAVAAAQALRSTARTAELPKAWLEGAAAASDGVAVHGDAAAAIAKQLGAELTAGSELALIDAQGRVLAYDVITQATRSLGTLPAQPELSDAVPLRQA